MVQYSFSLPLPPILWACWSPLSQHYRLLVYMPSWFKKLSQERNKWGVGVEKNRKSKFFACLAPWIGSLWGQMRSRAHEVMQNTGLEAEVDKKPFWAADKLLIWETELLSFTVDSFNCQNASKRCLKRKCAAHNCYNAGTREQRNHGTKIEANKVIMTIKYRITKCESTVLWSQDSAKTHIIRLMPSQ